MQVILGVLIVGASIAVTGALFAVPTMLLWDWLMPLLFKLPTITLLQALGLNVLCGFLFKGSCSCDSSKK